MIIKKFFGRSREYKTQLAFIGMRLLSTPCWCLLTMLALILYKNAHLSPFQIALLVALKPASSLLSPYWSQAIYQKPHKIVSNLVWANLLRHAPFLLIPWVSSPWFIIFAFGLYMMLTRATIPAWMEIFKQNLPQSKPEQLIGYASTIDFCGTALLTILIGILLDKYPSTWKGLFAFTACLGILSTSFLSSLSLSLNLEASQKSPPSLKRPFNLNKEVLKPWKQVWQLISQHPDFTIFQVGFMLGGAGLMIMQPALPQFFIDTLHLSFVEMGLALALCKGVGVALTSPLWTRLFRKVDIFPFSALVTLFAALFPFLLWAASWHVLLIYLAYAFYGAMQAGSEMSWHMSGLVFAKEKESSLFSTTNVLTVGIRGCFIPFLGSSLLLYMPTWGVFLVGALLCLLASYHFLFFYQRIKNVGVSL